MAHSFDFQLFADALSAKLISTNKDLGRQERISAIFEMVTEPLLVGTESVSHLQMADIDSCIVAVNHYLNDLPLHVETDETDARIASDIHLFESMIGVQSGKDNLRHMKMKRTTVSKTFF